MSDHEKTMNYAAYLAGVRMVTFIHYNSLIHKMLFGCCLSIKKSMMTVKIVFVIEVVIFIQYQQ